MDEAQLRDTVDAMVEHGLVDLGPATHCLPRRRPLRFPARCLQPPVTMFTMCLLPPFRPRTRTRTRSYTFGKAAAFNSDLSKWDVSEVTQL